MNVAFSHDGSRIVTTSDDNTARLWDTTGRQLAVLKGHTGNVFFASFSPDGSRIATESFDRTLRLWDSKCELLASLPGARRWDRGLRFNEDSSRFVTGGTDNSARLWDRDGNLLAVMNGHTGEVPDARFNANGDRILTASHDRTARLWNEHGKSIAVLSGHDKLPLATFSADGNYVATTSLGGTTRLWDAVDGALLGVLEGHGASFSPDDGYVVTRLENRALLYKLVDKPQLPPSNDPNRNQDNSAGSRRDRTIQLSGACLADRIRLPSIADGMPSAILSTTKTWRDSL